MFEAFTLNPEEVEEIQNDKISKKTQEKLKLIEKVRKSQEESAKREYLKTAHLF